MLQNAAAAQKNTKQCDNLPNVRSCQVDSYPTGSGGQKEEKTIFFTLKTVDRLLSFRSPDATIQSFVGIGSEFAVF